jgi:hypothetical protein
MVCERRYGPLINSSPHIVSLSLDSIQSLNVSNKMGEAIISWQASISKLNSLARAECESDFNGGRCTSVSSLVNVPTLRDPVARNELVRACSDKFDHSLRGDDLISRRHG